MGEIPPLPLSMQQEPPQQGKERYVDFDGTKTGDIVTITTNLPEPCEIFVWDDCSRFQRQIAVSDGKIVIEKAESISKVIIDSGVFSSDASVTEAIGKKGRNLVGKYIKYHPIYGNRVYCELSF